MLIEFIIKVNSLLVHVREVRIAAMLRTGAVTAAARPEDEVSV